MFAKLAGTVYLDSTVESSTSLPLTNVLYVPEAAQNLFSLTVVDEKGGYFNTDPLSHQLFVYTKNDKCVAKASKPKGRQVWVIGEVHARRNVQERANAAVVGGTGDAALWHRRLGHPGQERFKAAATTYPNLAHLHEYDLRGACKSCGEAKSHRQPFSKFPGKVADEILEVVHTDLWVAPVNAPTWDGYKYGLSFVDAHSRMSVVYLLRSKSPYEVFEKFVNYKARMKLVTGKKIKILRSDQGKEYFGPFVNRLDMWGIKHEYTMAHTLKQNGVAERHNRTLGETVRAFLYDGNDKPDRSLWGEAFMTANYLKNRMPSRVIGMQTPH
jgi:Integrase core domain